MDIMPLFNNQDTYNQLRQQRYQKKLLAYYGGTFPLEYIRRVNRGLEAQRKLRAYWREKEGLPIHLSDSLLPDNLIAFKRTANNLYS